MLSIESPARKQDTSWCCHCSLADHFAEAVWASYLALVLHRWCEESGLKSICDTEDIHKEQTSPLECRFHHRFSENSQTPTDANKAKNITC